MTLEEALFTGPILLCIIFSLLVVGFLLWVLLSHHPAGLGFNVGLHTGSSHTPTYATSIMLLTTEQIARICHEANAAICRAHDDNSQSPWDDAPEWARKSSAAGVDWRLVNLDAPIEAQHVEWCKAKYADGWIYGAVKDAEKKTHPCLVEYDQLPLAQRLKDHVFVAIVTAAAKVTV